MNLLIDAHTDLAYNILRYRRDYARSAAHIRAAEKDNPASADTLAETETATLGWEDYQRGNIAVIFSTLFALPARWNHSENLRQVYKTFDEAHRICREQLDVYRRLTDSTPQRFRLIGSQSELQSHLAQWNAAAENRPVGLIPLMEGAEAIRSINELEEWRELGLRIIGPAWVGTRYSGGWREPGALTADGRKLLAAMAEFNFILDISHMDELAALQALDEYRGSLYATHGTCLSLLPNVNSNRFFSDRVIEKIIERDGVIGVAPYNAYLKAGWTAGKNSRAEVPLDVVANHLDHICQIAGDALHAGIGSDFDGGFGLESIPDGMDTIADLQKISAPLQARGYSAADIENILGGNWLARLRRDLPK
ncbi:MAG: membrane dipeptidase [Anaerolineales bacterium]